MPLRQNSVWHSRKDEVRLIHGRGKGVQRARVHKFLRGDDRVERFEEAPPGRGGWGATLVWLRAAS